MDSENEELNLDEIDSLNIISDDINIDELGSVEDIEDNGLISNDILDNNEELNLGLEFEQIREFYDYLAGKKARPVFAEKFFADGESRIRESSQLTTMMSLSFVPKLLAMEQSLIDSISSPESLKYLSIDEKLTYLKTLSEMSNKFNEQALKYQQNVKDLSSMPLVYRQLLDQLLIIPSERLPRLKVIPKLVDLPDEIWDRVIEITKID